MASYLSNDFDVTVVCSVPCYLGKIDDKYKGEDYYTESYNNIRIIRVPVREFDKKNKISRIRHIISYYRNTKKVIRVLKKKEQFDLVFATSQPPLMGGMLGAYAKRKLKGPMIYNIQDFQPEQTIAVGYIKIKPLLCICKKIDIRSCKKSDMVITVGEDMKETLEKRFKNKNVPSNCVINNWIDESTLYPVSKNDKHVLDFKKKYHLDGKFVIMYSGNIGLYYDLENIANTITAFKDREDIVFAFVGDGAFKKHLEELFSNADCNNVVFIPYQNKEDLIYSLNAADVHLVSNAKGIKGVSVPSKIYGVLATNIPCVGILEENSTAYNIIISSNCGETVEPGSKEELFKLLLKVVDKKEDFVKKHSSGYDYLKKNFTMELSLEKYRNVIEETIEKNHD